MWTRQHLRSGRQEGATQTDPVPTPRESLWRGNANCDAPDTHVAHHLHTTASGVFSLAWQGAGTSHPTVRLRTVCTGGLLGPEEEPPLRSPPSDPREASEGGGGSSGRGGRSSMRRSCTRRGSSCGRKGCRCDRMPSGELIRHCPHLLGKPPRPCATTGLTRVPGVGGDTCGAEPPGWQYRGQPLAVPRRR